MVPSSLRLTLMLAATLLWPGLAAAQRQMEHLNRGLVAVRKSTTQVYLSWRLFGDDPTALAFNLYRSANGGPPVKLNASPLTLTTDFTDAPGATNLANNTYAYWVKPVLNGSEQAASATATLPAAAAVRQYLAIPLRTDPGPHGPYDTKFAWVGDLDGDGDYDFVIDRLSTLGAHEQFLEAYTNDGGFLWRMAMGPNSINQYAYEPGASAISIGDTDNVTVYDLNGDGRAEVMVRTANGVTVTNAAGLPVADIAASDTAQFLSVIDGLTGVELGRAPLPNPWAAHGTLTNKAMIAYLDGKRPSVVMYGYNRADSGGFHRVFTAWDFRNGTLTQRWTWAQNPAQTPGAEGHQVRIADVDNDGRDEICDIGHVLDDDGRQLYATPLTHGDRFHIADINPERPGLETYAIQQNNPTMLATACYDSKTGAMLKKWYAGGMVDVGRGIAIDLAAAHLGYEMYSTQPGIFNAKGGLIYPNNIWAPEGLWWDGDLGREFIDGAGSGALSPTIQKFNAATGASDRVYSIYPEGVHQAYGGRPAFWGDLLGDWREELVFMANNYAELRIYTTTIPATNRLYTLMHNPQYRCQATTKGYVQASYVDYYLGFGMPAGVPPPPMIPATLTWAGGGTWDVGTTAVWTTAAGTAATYAQGDSVLFDIAGTNATAIALSGDLTPSAVAFFNPQDFTVDGTAGRLAGSMSLSKSGAGKVVLGGTHSYTGPTTIWDGALVVNGKLTGSPVSVWGGTWGGALAGGETGGRLAGTGTISQPVKVEYRGAITPGAGMGAAGTLTLGSSLAVADGAVLAFDLSADPTGGFLPNDRLNVAGNLHLSGTVTVLINALNGSLTPGTYQLISYGGTLTGSAANLAVNLPAGTPHTLTAANGAVTLTIPMTRAPASLVWTGAADGSTWDLATTANWSRAGTADTFVAGDAVTFAATGPATADLDLTTELPVAGIVVATDGNFSFNGPGAIAGTGGLTKSGGGTLTLATTNSYTGPTVVTGGTLAVASLNDGGSPSSIGAAGTAATQLVLDGGTLALSGPQTNTNRSLTLGAAGGTLAVPTATSLQISGQLTGPGGLTKTGAGTLILAAANSFTGGTTITAGKLLLATDTANVAGLGNGLVTLNGGTLAMTDNGDVSSAATSGWSLHVPAGTAGRLNADGRCTLTGALTGGGEFTFFTPYVRTELSGNWSAFTGRIRVIADDDGGDFRIKNAAGYPAAALDLGAAVNAYFNQTLAGNLTFPIGTLAGAADAVLTGGLTAGKTLTWQVGGRHEDSTFAGRIADGTGPSALTKTGTGTLTLSGDSAFTGATTVAGGRLQVNGSTTGSNYTVQDGATLGGSGTITGNVTVLGGGGLEHGALNAAPLHINGNLAFAANAIVRPAAGAIPAAGSYPVVSYTGTLSGTPALVWDAPPGARLAATFITTTPGTITLVLAPGPRGPGPVIWSGATDFNWDPTTPNWTADGLSTIYQTGDTPAFTDAGPATSPVAIAADVQPAAVIVNAAKNYTFSGSGAITGTGSLTKAGSGSLNLSTAHGYSGGTYLNGGTLNCTTDAATAGIGSGPVVFNGGTLQQFDSNGTYNSATYELLVPAGQAGTLRCDSRIDLRGTLAGAGSLNVYVPWVRFKLLGDWSAFTGTLAVTTDADGGLFRFANTSGMPLAALELTNKATVLSYLNQTHTIPLGSLGGVAGSTLSGIVPDNSTPAAGTVVTWRIGGRGGDSTFHGIIQNGAGTSKSAVEKTGSGVLTLTGASTYTGATSVTGGTLAVTGSLAASPVTVTAAGTLGGSGSLGGPVTCHGTLAPGGPSGTLTLAAGLVLGPDSTLDYELGSAADFTAVGGDLTLDGTLHVTATAGFGAGVYPLLGYSGVLTNHTLAIGSLPAGFAGAIDTTAAGRVNLVVTAVNSAPQLTAGPAAMPVVVTTTTTSLSLTASDDAGEENLTYTWSASGPAPVSFMPNASHQAKTSLATFTGPGFYTLNVSVRDAPGLTAAGATTVAVISTPAALTLAPTAAALACGDTQPFTASLFDQFGNRAATPAITWSATGGTIDQAGRFTATAAGGPWQVSASHGGLTATATVTVAKAAATVVLDDLTATYDGKPKPATAITQPPGLGVTVTYAGSPTPPILPGSYPVTAVIDDPNHVGSATGTLRLAPRSFAAWQAGAFTPAQFAAGEAAPEADPDRDGLTNLAEYAVGGQPYAFTPLPSPTLDASGLSLGFQRPAWIGDVTYHGESSADCTNWSALDLEVLTPGSDPETVRVTSPRSAPPPAVRFLRLRFELNSP
jgi:autotransporter-associated beta strand protein